MNQLIIIVIYNKKIKNLTIFREEIQELTDIFIYDNSPTPQELPDIGNVSFFYEHDANNSGVSRAYNRGFLKAKELNKDTVLLLDHDTIFRRKYLELYEKQYAIYGDDYLYAPIISDSNKIKIYSPAMLNHFIGKAIPFDDFEAETMYDLTDKSVINSGLMIPLPMFEKIGGFNEKLKLDFSDIYFIEKYKELNSEIILINLYIKHSISGDEGKNYKVELSRFRYYCNGAREFSKSIDKKSTLVSLTRRMLRLILKYRSLKPIYIYTNYYLGDKIV